LGLDWDKLMVTISPLRTDHKPTEYQRPNLQLVPYWRP
jgi:hypothetical protein